MYSGKIAVPPGGGGIRKTTKHYSLNMSTEMSSSKTIVQDLFLFFLIVLHKRHLCSTSYQPLTTLNYARQVMICPFSHYFMSLKLLLHTTYL
jgi:hypothetical protein